MNGLGMARGLRWPKGSTKAPRGRQRGSGASQPLEREILRDCLAYLNAHPRVAFAFRANTGLVLTPDGKRRFKAGFKGCSDILGMTKTGRFFAVEVKQRGKCATEEQAAFLIKVSTYGGYGAVAHDTQDCRLMLESLPTI